MVEFFEKYASLLNLKIIIMSATLPKLDYFLEHKNNFVDLIRPHKRNDFFEDPLFKDRVKTDFSLLNQKINHENLYEILQKQPKNKKILIEFIKKQSAREFYTLIKEDFDNVYELSGDDNKAYRQYVINESKKDKPLIIVATQVIEAGVDIDMDIGFKDISTLDSEEQFMGRINRSCLREGKVYFFNLDDVAKIYRGDHRLGFDLKSEKYQAILENKNFAAYYEEVLAQIKKSGDKNHNGLLTNHENFSVLLTKLNYKAISQTMTLINAQNFTLYFPFQIDISQYQGVKEFENIEDIFLTNGFLDGQKVWDEFKALNEIESFSKKEVQKSKINSLMQFFTFSLLKFNPKQQLPYYSYEFGGYFFIDDLSFIENGKFNRAKYLAKKEELFL
jgi:CRISPR-associated endonuclease/helicase Cas3